MQSGLSNPGIPVFNLLENPVAIVLVSQKWIDNRHVLTVIEAYFVPLNFALIIKQSVFCAASLVDLNNHDLPIFRVWKESTQILLKQNQTLTHHLKSLFQKLPVTVTDPVSGKGIHALGKLVKVDSDLIQLVVQTL